MIVDRLERTRAILWCLADYDPEMPVLMALGHLVVIEQVLDQLEKKQQADDSAKRPDYRGSGGVVDLVRDFAGDGAVKNLAKKGQVGQLAEYLSKATGCTAIVAMQAAVTLEATFGSSGGMI